MGGVDVEIEGDRWFEVLSGKVAEGTNPVGVKAASTALVGDSGVIKSVAENDFVIGKSRQDDFLDVLRAVGKVKKEFGARRNIFIVVVEEKMANELASHGTTGGAGKKNGFMKMSEVVVELLDEGAFTSTLASFERDEQFTCYH